MYVACVCFFFPLFLFRGRTETPMTAPEMVYFQDNNFHEAMPNELLLKWDKLNLTVDESAKVRISVWGYREDSVDPKLEFIDLIAVISIALILNRW